MEQDSHQTKAMVEVALALAMGFFSIMVLAMVSMGAGVVAKPATAGLAAGVSIIASTPSNRAAGDVSAPGTPVAAADLIIFHSGRFLDADMAPVDPALWRFGKTDPVLAVAPDLDFRAVMRARREIGGDGVTVTSLDGPWLARLRDHGPENHVPNLSGD
jgi:hypothetical protein